MIEDFMRSVFGVDLSHTYTSRILAENGVAAGLPANVPVQNTTGLRMPVPAAQVIEWILEGSEFSPEVLGGMYCYRIVSDGETRFVFAGRDWGMVFLVLYMRIRGAKPQSLPNDPNKRLDVLCEIIVHANDGAETNMASVRKTLRELGVPEKLSAYFVGEKYEPDNEKPDADVRFDLCLAHMANNPTASLTGDNTLEFQSGNHHYRLLDIPDELAKVGRAFAARNKRLYVSCVSASA